MATVFVYSEGIRVAVIDCDLHQGNGTAFIFKDDESVYTFSIHQRDLYPQITLVEAVEAVDISKADKEKIFSGNAERLLGLSG